MTTQSASWALQGGMDLVSPTLSVSPGRALLAQNYECDLTGRFRRMDGYTLYDGSASPVVVPGSGPVRGVHVYKGEVYACRDSDDETSGVMYKATSQGWVEIRRVNPGGVYEFCNHNFGGHSGTGMMYGVDGRNKAFQWDGTTYTEISTGMVNDTPHHLAIHKNHLFLGFSGGSLQHSGVGEPTDFAIIKGAAELGMGSEITGLHSLKNNILAVFAEDRIALLYGSSSQDWDLRGYKLSSGAIARTMAEIETDLHFYNGDEVASLFATQSFGDYESASVSALVKPFVTGRAAQVVGAMVHRDKNQYRLFFNDKSVLVSTIYNRQLKGHATWLIDHEPSCVTEGYMGCADGSVMKLDTTTGFNGGEIQSLFRSPFNSLRKPDVQKRFRKARVKLDAGITTTFNYVADYDFGQGGKTVQPVSVHGAGGFWGIARWDHFSWGGAFVSSAALPLNGTACNISLMIAHTSATETPFTLDSMSLSYTPRRPLR